MSRKYKSIVDAIEQALNEGTPSQRVIIENMIAALTDRRKDKELRRRVALDNLLKGKKR